MIVRQISTIAFGAATHLLRRLAHHRPWEPEPRATGASMDLYWAVPPTTDESTRCYIVHTRSSRRVRWTVDLADTESDGSASRAEQVERLRRFILERWPAFAATASRHQWPSEQERWHELAFCLTYRVEASAVDATATRAIIDVLARLDLLEVDTLASLVSDDGRVDLAHDNAILIQLVMVRLGLTQKAAETALVTLCEAASCLMRHHEGKVQRYLREYGERMLAEADRHFAFTRLPEADVGSALTHWLQNALSMPLALREPAMDDLARAFGLSTAEIIDLADELDVNVALLDDMVTGTSHPAVAETRPPEPV